MALNFPAKIYQILENESSEIIRWHANGAAFRIVDHGRFEREIIPKYFRHNQISSVQRQLNLYGFKCVSRGEDKGAFYHPRFKRGDWEIVKKITRYAPIKKPSDGSSPTNMFDMKKIETNGNILEHGLSAITALAGAAANESGVSFSSNNIMTFPGSSVLQHHNHPHQQHIQSAHHQSQQEHGSSYPAHFNYQMLPGEHSFLSGHAHTLQIPIQANTTPRMNNQHHNANVGWSNMQWNVHPHAPGSHSQAPQTQPLPQSQTTPHINNQSHSQSSTTLSHTQQHQSQSSLLSHGQGLFHAHTSNHGSHQPRYIQLKTASSHGHNHYHNHHNMQSSQQLSSAHLLHTNSYLSNSFTSVYDHSQGDSNKAESVVEEEEEAVEDTEEAEEDFLRSPELSSSASSMSCSNPNTSSNHNNSTGTMASTGTSKPLNNDSSSSAFISVKNSVVTVDPYFDLDDDFDLFSDNDNEANTSSDNSSISISHNPFSTEKEASFDELSIGHGPVPSLKGSLYVDMGVNTDLSQLHHNLDEYHIFGGVYMA